MRNLKCICLGYVLVSTEIFTCIKLKDADACSKLLMLSSAYENEYCVMQYNERKRKTPRDRIRYHERFC